MQENDHIFRAGSPATTANQLLGLLHNLPGRWNGKGFNLIARPARQGIPANPPFFLELNSVRRDSDDNSFCEGLPINLSYGQKLVTA